jgi:hypothetical protein
MAGSSDVVDGWEIRRRDDGSFGVYDFHGMLAGPFGTKEAAMAAALRLPRASGGIKKPQPLHGGGATGIRAPKR